MWPKLRYVPVFCWSTRLQCNEKVKIPVALPHETLDRIAQHSDSDTFAGTTKLTKQGRQHLSKVARGMALVGPSIVNLGF